MKICIVGFPRSGTKATAMAMRSAGFDFGHEKWYDNGGIGYMFSQLKNRHTMLSADVVAHQVRDPRKAIGSAMRNLSLATNLVKPFDGDWQAAWMYWNLLAEFCLLQAESMDIPTVRYRIEDGAKTFVKHQAYKALGVEQDIEWKEDDFNHRQDYPALSWKSMRPGVIRLARQYGYTEGILK